MRGRDDQNLSEHQGRTDGGSAGGSGGVLKVRGEHDGGVRQLDKSGVSDRLKPEDNRNQEQPQDGGKLYAV